MLISYHRDKEICNSFGYRHPDTTAELPLVLMAYVAGLL